MGSLFNFDSCWEVACKEISYKSRRGGGVCTGQEGQEEGKTLFWDKAAQSRESGVHETEALAAFLAQSSKLVVSMSVCVGSLVGCT